MSALVMQNDQRKPLNPNLEPSRVTSSNPNHQVNSKPSTSSENLGECYRRRRPQKIKRKMRRIILTSLFAASVLILILQATVIQMSDAKKIKIKIKDLKKAKKYAYLLASQRKKLYAIPFPVPLPVFVKRQHIYTQVPIVPRYVQQPQYEHHESSYDPYAAMSAYYPETVQHYPSHYPRKTVATIGKPTKYLAQLANAIGQTYPVLGSGYQIGNQRDVVGKFLSGQAKVLSPVSLISNLKQKSSNKPEQEKGDQKASSANSTTKQISTEPGDKPSASKVYLRSLPRPPALPYEYPTDVYRVPHSLVSMMHPYMSPYLPAAQTSGALVPQPMLYPMLHPQHLLQQMSAEQQLVEPIGGMINVAHDSPSQNQEHEVQETSASRPVQNVRAPGEARANPDQLVEALQKARHHQAIRLALAREREEARIAESNALALRAHQLGLPVIPSQLHLLNY